MAVDFIETFMNQIIESTMIPKVQVERIIGPLLGLFLEDVLTATFINDPEFSGEVKMISPEFPLKKPDNKQSTNIDWLMLNLSSSQLYLVELKTSDTSVSQNQSEIYRSISTKIRTEGGGFLLQDLAELRDISKESGKYNFVLQNKAKPFEKEIISSKSAKIIYIVPEYAQTKIKILADRVLSFRMLAKDISNPYAKEWKIIHSYLTKLDIQSLKSRNLQTTSQRAMNHQITKSQRIHWQGTLKFDEMVALCQSQGQDIIIGFTGGQAKFRETSLSSLQNRSHFKWDYSNNLNGKNRSDWLSGQEIIELLYHYHYPNN